MEMYRSDWCQNDCNQWKKVYTAVAIVQREDSSYGNSKRSCLIMEMYRSDWCQNDCNHRNALLFEIHPWHRYNTDMVLMKVECTWLRKLIQSPRLKAPRSAINEIFNVYYPVDHDIFRLIYINAIELCCWNNLFAWSSVSCGCGEGVSTMNGNI